MLPLVFDQQSMLLQVFNERKVLFQFFERQHVVFGGAHGLRVNSCVGLAYYSLLVGRSDSEPGGAGLDSQWCLWII